ncbi:MAG: hypothetical protein K0Q48_451 [Bacillota bacterium]|jgi:putative transposase|nr:hypothetical protein [Bacillota bacterium]
MGYYTITLKLHRPSRVKREILQNAMENYTRAFDYLLRQAEDGSLETEEFKAGGKYKLTKWVDKDMSARLNRFEIQPFKDSLKLDFAMTMSSYIELKDQGRKVGFPGTYEDSEGRLKSLRPIFFCRCDINRDYCLLYDEDKNKYFVKLYLLNQRSALVREPGRAGESRLSYIHKKSQPPERNAARERFVILPLSFGVHQEAYLKRCLDQPEMLKTARLIQKNGAFYMAVNLELPDEERLEAESFMGVSRGPGNSLSITVTDVDGTVVEVQTMVLQAGKRLRGGKPPAEIYLAAKRVVEKALYYRCKVILENLAEYTDKASDLDFGRGKDQRVLRKSTYQAFERILRYKLDFAGLPTPVQVSPFGIFSTCPKCGLNSKKSVTSKEMFLCVSCGAAYQLKYLGSINLSNKLIKYQKDDIKIKVINEASGIRLSNEILGLNMEMTGTEDVMVHLNRNIKELIREAKDSGIYRMGRREYRKKWSLIQKIESYDDITKHITFI